MTIREKAAAMKLDSTQMASKSAGIRNQALANIVRALVTNQEDVFRANAQDMAEAEQDHVPEAVVKRLKFDEQKLTSTVKGVEELIELPDKVYETQFMRELDEGLTLVRESCPIGVIGVIFEARPDALVQGACVSRAETVRS
jgi:glutamate-5-semialdehyde dehydrogenase